jgi:hypothetical protein
VLRHAYVFLCLLKITEDEEKKTGKKRENIIFMSIIKIANYGIITSDIKTREKLVQSIHDLLS